MLPRICNSCLVSSFVLVTLTTLHLHLNNKCRDSFCISLKEKNFVKQALFTYVCSVLVFEIIQSKKCKINHMCEGFSAGVIYLYIKKQYTGLCK